MKNILIIEKNPSGIMGLRTAHEMGLFVILMSADKYNNKATEDDLLYIDLLYRVDTNDYEAVWREIEKINRIHPLSGIMTFLDYYVPLVAEISSRLGVPGLSPNDGLCAHNKYLMRQRHRQCGVSIPMYKIANSLDDTIKAGREIGYPNVVKPVNLSASRNVWLNSNEEEIKRHYHDIMVSKVPFGIKKESIVLIENYMNGKEYSVESISYKGHVKIVAITEKSVNGQGCFVEVGHIVPAPLTPEIEKKICELTIDAVTSLGIKYGGSHTELKLTTDGPKIVEVAARLGGDYIPELVQDALGVNLWKANIMSMIGECPKIKKKKCKCAGITYLTGHEGKIKSIKNNYLTKDKNIKRVCLEVAEGDKTNTLQNSSNRLGYAMVIGADYQEVIKQIKRVHQLIKVEN